MSSISISLIVRCLVGGVFMGLANLVPGISGGTMLLAVGIYPLFIAAIAGVTSLKFKLSDFVVLASVGIAAVLAILIFAGTIKTLVVEQREFMYSLFIGLTLGGVPLLKNLLGSFKARDCIFVFLGIVIMTLLALAQMQGWGTSESGEEVSTALLFIAGSAGAAAMILPGVSGGYLLLILGCYIPILSGIDQLKLALKAADYTAAMQVITSIVLPVGFGVIFGVVFVSHLMKWFLKNRERETYSVLTGLLLGAVVGLFPFVGADSQVYMPGFKEFALALFAVTLGLALTLGISKVSPSDSK